MKRSPPPRKKKAAPAGKATPSTRAQRTTPLTPASSETASLPLVLVVDDYEDAREMYCEYLQFSGFRTAEAKTGVEALKEAASALPDLILMDLSLPEMDGWEATRRLKASAKTKHIPVVALTGHALAGHSESAREAGCDSFVAKPCLPEDLVVEVRRLLAASSPKKSLVKRRARS